MTENDIQDVVTIWQAYLATAPHWQQLINGVTPKNVGCGLVYELPNPASLNRPNEDFIIADMRALSEKPGYSESHYHSAGLTEIYFVLEGSALSVVGNVKILLALAMLL